METLFAYSYLWTCGFCSAQAYNERLDALFSAQPEDARLLELEECSSRCKDTFARLNRYFEYEASAFDADAFGEALFAGLETAYRSGACDVASFGKKCYELWKLLPESVGCEQPFYALCCADEPLPWGEKQNRALLERAFTFYQKK